MRHIASLLLIWITVACTSPEVRHDRWAQREGKKRYEDGVRAAKEDLARGTLATEATISEEEPGMRVWWCYRKLLAERYRIEFRWTQASPAPGIVEYRNGYNSVSHPRIAAKLGSDWERRTHAEAEQFYRNHWSEVAHLYSRDVKNNAW